MHMKPSIRAKGMEVFIVKSGRIVLSPKLALLNSQIIVAESLPQDFEPY